MRDEGPSESIALLKAKVWTEPISFPLRVQIDPILRLTGRHIHDSILQHRYTRPRHSLVDEDGIRRLDQRRLVSVGLVDFVHEHFVLPGKDGHPRVDQGLPIVREAEELLGHEQRGPGVLAMGDHRDAVTILGNGVEDLYQNLRGDEGRIFVSHLRMDSEGRAPFGNGIFSERDYILLSLFQLGPAPNRLLLYLFYAQGYGFRIQEVNEAGRK
mmetsp:Transcript_34118/g.82501  ORF Transcript_34118/g.82501 Transcript_34118/m.82501 type:complete len:213 (+) Transcript_34118:1542-2180(+)